MASHQAKFRWTENLTCRFIQLRKDNGKLFTGRKYSAQAGWEYILHQMREEFPLIMADVHFRVLKKKWSNLLQQYKELRNPVHGDRNKADDVSWPFYTAIDEVLGNAGFGTPTNNDEYIDPQEFLCVSVTPEEPATSGDALPAAESNPEAGCKRGPPFADRLRGLNEGEPSAGTGKVSRDHSPFRQPGKNHSRRKRDSRGGLTSGLPDDPAPMEKSLDGWKEEPRGSSADSTMNKGQLGIGRNEDEERPRKSRRTATTTKRTTTTTRGGRPGCRRHEDHESRIDRRIEEIFEYAKQRDEENRSIMVRIMHTVEKIANKL